MEWVSTSERLPSETRRVLVKDGDKENPRISIAYLDEGQWMISLLNTNPDIIIGEVFAWRDLS